MLGGDRSVADVLAHHGPVFAFHQSVVSGAIGPRLGELDQQLVEQPGQAVIEELRAVVGVEAAQAKGELVQHCFQHWDQAPLRDRLDAADDLSLRDRIDSVDVIQPRPGVPVTLVHRIDAQIAGQSLRLGLAPLGDPDLSCLRAIEHHPLRAISPRSPQVVDGGAFWRDENSSNSDVEIIRTMRRGMANVPDAKLVKISTPYAKASVLWDDCRRRHELPEVLVVQAPTWVMNASISERFLERERDKDRKSTSESMALSFRTAFSRFFREKQ